MEQQFELHSTPNYRIIVENARKYGVGPRIPTVIITFLIMIFLVIYAEQMGFLGKIWHIIAIVAGIDLILFFLPHAFTLYGFSILKKQNNGTLPEAINWARPSAMAVFPTPGSPIRHGLFFVLRESMRMTLRISSSLPITGSSLRSRARSTRSVPYFLSTL